VTTAEAIEMMDLLRVLGGYKGTFAFEQTLRAIRGKALLSPLANYIQFNSVFGSGVANLAGEIGVRQDLFRDQHETAAMFADRSVEVAAKIFYAAIDEFGDAGTTQRSTHRSLSLATLRGTADFFNCPTELLNMIADPDEMTTSAIGKVCQGYGLDQTLNDCQIFRGIGFHLASETLADEEFGTLDRVLRLAYPELVAYLEHAQLAINGCSCPGYLWIRLHTTVEAEHRAAALDGANMALQYYAGAEGRACVREWILEGARRFAAIQSDFMEGLRSNSSEW
jgi:hypothetical protein